MTQEQKLRKKYTLDDYENAIGELLRERGGMIHHSDLSARMGVSANTAISYLRIYAKRHNLTYLQGWLMVENEGTA
jgi:Mn-dependent DtxR family transcriptional regulator